MLEVIGFEVFCKKDGCCCITRAVSFLFFSVVYFLPLQLFLGVIVLMSVFMSVCKPVLLRVLVFMGVCIGIYIPQVHCASEDVKLRSISSQLAGLQLGSEPKTATTNLGRPVRTHPFTRRINTSPVCLKAEQGKVFGGLNARTTGYRATCFLNMLSRIGAGARAFGRSQFVSGAAGVAGPVAGVLAVGLVIGWLTIDFDTYSMTSPMQRVDQFVEYRSARAAKRVGVPEVMKAQIQNDLNHYFYSSYQLDSHSGQAALQEGETTRGHVKSDEKQPIQGDWIASSGIGTPEINVSVRCDKGGYRKGKCRALIHIGGNWYSKGVHSLGTLRIDPDKKEECWGVMPTINSLAHHTDSNSIFNNVASLIGPRTKGLPRPYIVHAKVEKNSKGQDEVVLEYFNFKGKSVLETFWRRYEECK